MQKSYKSKRKNAKIDNDKLCFNAVTDDEKKCTNKENSARGVCCSARKNLETFE